MITLNDMHMLAKFPVKYHSNDHFQYYVILFEVMMLRK